MKVMKMMQCGTLLAALALAACGEHETDGSFTNPGDNLGGAKQGTVPGAVDDAASVAVRQAMADKVDLTDLAANTAGEDAIEIAATDGIVEISEAGTYLFKGAYGGIKITKKDIDVHFIFDGATFTNDNGIAIDGTDKKPGSIIITLMAGTTNTVTNGGTDVNAIHVKAPLSFNGTGTLIVTSDSKSAVKSSKAIQIADATLNLAAKNHALTASSVTAVDSTISVAAAGKDGINAECGSPKDGFTTDDGFVALRNVTYTCSVDGDGIQADTAVYIDGGTYDIKTSGTFVQKTSANMETYGMTADDFKYIKSGSTYQRIASDEANRYGSNLYGLSQGCKGIKVGEIEYNDDAGNTVTVPGDYLIAIAGGMFKIDSTDDAIHANSGNVLIEGGTFTIATSDDGITAAVLTKITGGKITVTQCYEGIEGGYVEIGGGTVIDITAADDGINAASDDTGVSEHIIISGGDITVDSSGDGIDSNGSILVSGGSVTVYGPTNGSDAGLDADSGIVINGGTLFATAAIGMVETPSTNSGQCVVSYAHQSTISAGATVILRDSSGNELLPMPVKKNCQSIIFSAPGLEKGGTYTLYSGSTKLTGFTVSSVITTIGTSGSTFPGGNGGMRH